MLIFTQVCRAQDTGQPRQHGVHLRVQVQGARHHRQGVIFKILTDNLLKHAVL